eukprot:6466863-Amphidinium_carterae.1
MNPTLIRQVFSAAQSNPQHALVVLDGMHRQSVQAQGPWYAKVANEMGDWECGLSLIEELRALAGRRTGAKSRKKEQATSNVLVKLCTAKQAWETAVQVLDDMEKRGLEVSAATLTCLTKSQANFAWQKALRFFTTLVQNGQQVNERIVASVMTGFQPQALWFQACEFLSSATTKNIPWNEYAMASSISECGAANEWELALARLESTYGEASQDAHWSSLQGRAATHAVAQAMMWQQAFALTGRVDLDAKMEMAAHT